MGVQQKPKRRHHHVWQHYLKPWTTGGAIWCRQDGRIYNTGTPVVAVETDFYKLQNLTAPDIALVRLLFRDAPALVQRNNEHLLGMLLSPFAMGDEVDRVVKRAAREAIQAAVDQFASQVLEDYHAGVEEMAIPLLDLALEGDLSFYEDDRCISFVYFLATQYMRTKGIKERSIEICRADNTADLSRVWNILIHMFAGVIGASLYLQRRRARLTLVANETDVPFVTGDQPLINLKASRPQGPPEELSIYYPIAPNLALILPEVDEEPMFPATGLTGEQAAALNGMLAEACYRQVFAVSRASLLALPPTAVSV